MRQRRGVRLRGRRSQDGALTNLTYFHLQCVGLKKAPGLKEKWICPECVESKKNAMEE